MTTYTYKTSMFLSFADTGTNTHVPIEFEYTVRPGSEPTREHPGEAASVGISKITMTDSKGTRYRAHDWLWEIVEGDEELGDLLIAEAAADDESSRDLRDALRGEHIE